MTYVYRRGWIVTDEHGVALGTIHQERTTLVTQALPQSLPREGVTRFPSDADGARKALAHAAPVEAVSTDG